VDLEKFQSEFGPSLLHTAKILCGDTHAAEDLVQDVWARVAKTDSRPEIGKELAWLMQILRNRKIDRLRSESKLRLTNVTDIQSPDSERETVIDRIAMSDEEPSSDRLDLSDAIRDCLQRLEISFRTVLILFYFEQLSYEEIAKSLDCSRGTVSSRANRGREMVRNCMARKGWS
jgi:RNA polymerase sigma-70 factor (ECF subfamily)